jgi:hypothetical protein
MPTIHVSSGIRTQDPNNQAAKSYALDRAATWNGTWVNTMYAYKNMYVCMYARPPLWSSG